MIINIYIALFFEVTQRAEILYIIDNIILQLLSIVHVTDYNQYPVNISSRCISWRTSRISEYMNFSVTLEGTHSDSSHRSNAVANCVTAMIRENMFYLIVIWKIPKRMLQNREICKEIDHQPSLEIHFLISRSFFVSMSSPTSSRFLPSLFAWQHTDGICENNWDNCSLKTSEMSLHI